MTGDASGGNGRRAFFMFEMVQGRLFLPGFFMHPWRNLARWNSDLFRCFVLFDVFRTVAAGAGQRGRCGRTAGCDQADRGHGGAGGMGRIKEIREFLRCQPAADWMRTRTNAMRSGIELGGIHIIIWVAEKTREFAPPSAATPPAVKRGATMKCWRRAEGLSAHGVCCRYRWKHQQSACFLFGDPSVLFAA